MTSFFIATDSHHQLCGNILWNTLGTFLWRQLIENLPALLPFMILCGHFWYPQLSLMCPRLFYKVEIAPILHSTMKYHDFEVLHTITVCQECWQRTIPMSSQRLSNVFLCTSHCIKYFISLNPHIFVGQRKGVREIRKVERKTRRDEVTAWDPVHRIHACSTLACPSQDYLHGCPFPIGVHGIVFTVFGRGAGLVIKPWEEKYTNAFHIGNALM